MRSLLMAFVRIKTIKGKEYAYLVENTWENNQSRQKVLKYLGGVTHAQTDSVPADGVEGLYQAFVDSLIYSTLLGLHFACDDPLYKNGDMVVNTLTRTMTRNGKPLVLRVNEGFLCKETWEQLRDFVRPDSHAKTGERFAKLVLEAGLLVQQNQFVRLFELAPREIERKHIKS